MNNTFDQLINIKKNSYLDILQEYKKENCYIIVLKYFYLAIDFDITTKLWARKALKLDIIALTTFAFAFRLKTSTTKILSIVIQTFMKYINNNEITFYNEKLIRK